ncbi:hypothetical protein HC031_15920 [Planosporangium thailandense]|uniref:Alpha/beta hydrolase n=1 Tax=Planosporangium thailandense TaxID=765197 RepID=A0ABX0XYS1_9ACTN|nr:hypothetical protein [Planosporangium thailandense]NJC71188.1 hypothetical protein [Planosporangium thailandense]
MPRRLPALVALTAAPAGVEALALRAGGFAPALAPQASAPAPVGVFHDLRWIVVYHDSWPAFAVEVAAGIVVRALLTTAIVAAAWPADRPSPSLPGLLRVNLLFTVLAVVALAPWAAVTAAASVTSLSWLLVGVAPPLVLLTLVLQCGGVTGGWWRGLPPLPALAWGVAGFALFTVDAVIAGVTPGWWTVPVSAVLGALNAVLWYGLVAAAVAARPRLARVPVAPAAMVLTVGSIAAMSVFAPLGSAAAARPPPPLTAHGLRAPDQALMYVAGYDSVYDGRPRRAGLPLVRYSYRGLDGNGRPLPYDAASTHQSLALSARRVAAQVAAVHARTGRPVALIAQSEGTLVVRTYLETFPHPAVDAAVQLDALPQPSRGYYPPPGAGSGWGVATGWELRAIIAVVRATSGARLSPDEPLLRSLLDDGPLYRDRMLCPVPGVRMIAFVSTDSAVVDPPAGPSGIPVIRVTGLHGTLYGRADVQRTVVAFLDGATPGGARVGYYPLAQRAAAAWQAPALRPELNPVWRSGRHAGGPGRTGQPGCRG